MNSIRISSRRNDGTGSFQFGMAKLDQVFELTEKFVVRRVQQHRRKAQEYTMLRGESEPAMPVTEGIRNAAVNSTIPIVLREDCSGQEKFHEEAYERLCEDNSRGIRISGYLRLIPCRMTSLEIEIKRRPQSENQFQS